MDTTTANSTITKKWLPIAQKELWPKDGGMAVKHGDEQIAVFNFASRGEWYAVQNQCPHKGQMALARGIVGDRAGEPKVACPFHKKQFSLQTGQCFDDNACGNIKTYPVKVEGGMVYVEVEAY